MKLKMSQFKNKSVLKIMFNLITSHKTKQNEYERKKKKKKNFDECKLVFFQSVFYLIACFVITNQRFACFKFHHHDHHHHRHCCRRLLLPFFSILFVVSAKQATMGVEEFIDRIDHHNAH